MVTGLQWLAVLEAVLWLTGLITWSVLVCKRGRRQFKSTPLFRYTFSTSLEVGIPPDTVVCTPPPCKSPPGEGETINVIPNRQGTGIYFYTGAQRFGSINVIGVVVGYWLLVFLYALYNLYATRDTGLIANVIYDYGRFPAMWVQFAGFFCLVVLLAALAAGIREFYIIILLMLSKPVQYFCWGCVEYALHQNLRVSNPFFVPEWTLVVLAWLGALVLLIATWYVLIAAMIVTWHRLNDGDAEIVSGQFFPEPGSFALFVAAGVVEALIFLILLAQMFLTHTRFMVFEWTYQIVFFAGVIAIGISLGVAAIRAKRRLLLRGQKMRPIRVFKKDDSSSSCSSSSDENDNDFVLSSKTGRKHRHKVSFPRWYSMFAPLLIRFGHGAFWERDESDCSDDQLD